VKWSKRVGLETQYVVLMVLVLGLALFELVYGCVRLIGGVIQGIREGPIPRRGFEVKLNTGETPVPREENKS
jgi:hypothetical protein